MNYVDIGYKLSDIKIDNYYFQYYVVTVIMFHCMCIRLTIIELLEMLSHASVFILHNVLNQKLSSTTILTL